MMRHIFFILITGILLMSTFSQSNLASAVSDKKLSIPKHAVEIAPGIYHLGQAKDKDGKTVEGIMIIDYKKGNAKPSGVGGGKGGTSSCYSFLASGAKWKTQEPWVINPSNNEGLDTTFVFSNTASNIQKWENAGAGDIFGAGTQTTSALIADEISPDGINEVYFGIIDDPNTIAVTIVWGVFSGPVKQRYLSEWDQVFDENSFNWSSIGEAGKMDYENISTHEIGHAFGIGHPSSSCTEETMYAYASNGETKKRDLNSGDIAGINALY
ncbi:MAG: matrixin family metalloprotease [Candidatus Nitrosotenuis sp.]